MSRRSSSIPDLSADLRRIVKPAVAEVLLPRLEQAIRAYRSTDVAVAADRAAEARRATALAKRLALIGSLADRLSAQIDLLPAEVRTEALAALRPTSRLGDLGRGMSARRLPEVNTTLAKLQRWTRGAASKAQSRRKRNAPGRQIGIRRQLASFVAEELERAGAKASKSADGVLAKVLGLVYDAAAIPSPIELFPDVNAAVEALRRSRTSK